MMGRHFAGDPRAPASSLAYQLQRFPGRDVRDVHRSLSRDRQCQIPLHALCLCRVRVTFEAQPFGRRASINCTTAGKAAVLFVQRNREPERADFIQGAGQERLIIDRHPVVGKESRAGLGHGPVVDAGPSFKPARHGCYRDESCAARRARLFEHVAGDLRRIIDRSGVSHRGDRGETTRGCSAQTAADGFLLREAGIAQMHVNIDQTRHHPTRLRVNDGAAFRRKRAARRAQGSDPAVNREDVEEPLGPGSRIDYAAAAQQDHAHFTCSTVLMGSTIE